MRVGIRSILAARKIRAALLLGVVPIAMLIPGSNMALSQSRTGTVTQAPLYTAIDLNPSGFATSEASGSSSGEQVGYGSGPATGDRNHALLWRGTADSVMDLNPSGFEFSFAFATCGGQQVGAGAPPRDVNHALLWRGSANTVVDLNPPGFEGSEALATSCGEQVGRGFTGQCCDATDHPLLWRGNAASVVDLYPSSKSFGAIAWGTSGGQQVGVVYGRAVLWRGNAKSAVSLHPRGFEESWAHGTSGGEQVGSGVLPGTCVQGESTWPGNSCHHHALLWRGSAASVVDLHPPGFTTSEAFGTCGRQQVGRGFGSATGNAIHALLWRGSADSVVDLHTFLPSGFTHSWAWHIDADGDIVGSASTEPWTPGHAFLWKRNTSTPGTSGEQDTMRC